ncbi:MAG: hypothetical protein ACI810_002837, partial [Gammaproteobacteria bacterium]
MLKSAHYSHKGNNIGRFEAIEVVLVILKVKCRSIFKGSFVSIFLTLLVARHILDSYIQP